MAERVNDFDAHFEAVEAALYALSIKSSSDIQTLELTGKISAHVSAIRVKVSRLAALRDLRDHACVVS